MFSSQPPEDDYPEDISFRKHDPLKYKRVGGRPVYEKSMEGRQAAALYLLSQGHECTLHATFTHPELEGFSNKVSLGSASAEGLAFIVKSALPHVQEQYDAKINSMTFDWKEKKATKDEEKREKAKRTRELLAYEQLKQVFNMLRCVIRVSFLVSLPEKGRLRRVIRVSFLVSLPEKGRLRRVIRVSFLVSLPENYNA
jgi:hypothetical protein